jgi:perosamine synthetase
MASADLEEFDIEAVMAVLKSGRLALGPRLGEFGRSMAEYVGVRHALAVTSGTAALHFLVKGLGLGPGDEVLVPSFTFSGQRQRHSLRASRAGVCRHRERDVQRGSA